MISLTKTQWLILNSTTDDWENLEQIYRSICLEFSSERYNPSDPNSFYWRESAERILLAEIIDNLALLVDEGFLSVKVPDSDAPSNLNNDVSYLWRGWFKITPKGRARLTSAESQWG
jgi:hypothetical protein